jgi:hypothetical protein
VFFLSLSLYLNWVCNNPNSNSLQFSLPFPWFKFDPTYLSLNFFYWLIVVFITLSALNFVCITILYYPIPTATVKTPNNSVQWYHGRWNWIMVADALIDELHKFMSPKKLFSISLTVIHFSYFMQGSCCKMHIGKLNWSLLEISPPPISHCNCLLPN